MSKPIFNPDDVFQFESTLGEEERLIMESAREYAQTHLEPRALEGNQEGVFHEEIPKELGELGLLGATLPEEYGGVGASHTAYGLIARELERVDSGYRSFASVQSSLVMHPINIFGTEELKQKYLPRLATAELIGCFGLTEPNSGSDPGSMTTNIKADGDYYILNGAKMWITNSPIADVAVVWAKDEEGIIRGVIVDMDTPGCSAPKIEGKLSLRASITGELVFEDARIHKSQILPNVKGLKGPLSCLTKARYGIAWGAIGAGLDCYDSALRYSLEREQFGKPIGGFQLTQKKLAEMITEITKAQLLAWRLGTLFDQGKATPAQVSMAKRNNVHMALEIAREARQIHGGMGITNEYPCMRHMMNLETVLTYEGTHDIHLLITGMDITGLNAFK